MGSESDREKMEVVARILRTKDYYDMLGIPRNANDDQIKKSYKKLAFQLHPDKNKAQGAEEAFKQVACAFQCLSDPSKRAVYDQFGTEQEGAEHYRQRYEQEYVSPQEIFARFFEIFEEGGRHGGRVYRRRHPHWETRQQEQQSLPFQFIPVLIILLVFTLSSSLFIERTPTFSMYRTRAFPIERHTSDLRIAYYVAKDGTTPDARQLAQMEQQVEMAYVEHLYKECRQEEMLAISELQRARTMGNGPQKEAALARIKERKQPHCFRLKQMKTLHPQRFASAGGSVWNF